MFADHRHSSTAAKPSTATASWSTSMVRGPPGRGGERERGGDGGGDHDVADAEGAGCRGQDGGHPAPPSTAAAPAGPPLVAGAGRGSMPSRRAPRPSPTAEPPLVGPAGSRGGPGASRRPGPGGGGAGGGAGE